MSRRYPEIELRPIEQAPDNKDEIDSKKESIALLKRIILNELKLAAAGNEVGRLRIEVVDLHHKLDAASDRQMKIMRKLVRLRTKLGELEGLG